MLNCKHKKIDGILTDVFLLATQVFVNIFLLLRYSSLIILICLCMQIQYLALHCYLRWNLI